jgi:hypothetical protein
MKVRLFYALVLSFLFAIPLFASDSAPATLADGTDVIETCPAVGDIGDDAVIAAAHLRYRGTLPNSPLPASRKLRQTSAQVDCYDVWIDSYLECRGELGLGRFDCTLFAAAMLALNDCGN